MWARGRLVVAVGAVGLRRSCAPGGECLSGVSRYCCCGMEEHRPRTASDDGWRGAGGSSVDVRGTKLTVSIRSTGASVCAMPSFFFHLRALPPKPYMCALLLRSADFLCGAALVPVILPLLTFSYSYADCPLRRPKAWWFLNRYNRR